MLLGLRESIWAWPQAGGHCPLSLKPTRPGSDKNVGTRAGDKQTGRQTVGHDSCKLAGKKDQSGVWNLFPSLGSAPGLGDSQGGGGSWGSVGAPAESGPACVRGLSGDSQVWPSCIHSPSA